MLHIFKHETVRVSYSERTIFGKLCHVAQYVVDERLRHNISNDAKFAIGRRVPG